jgi:two-component sensor histidine kinase
MAINLENPGGFGMDALMNGMEKGSAIADRLLLREFLHRTMNELASAIALVSVEAARCENSRAKGTLSAVKDRLLSYARVQRSLQRPEHSYTIEVAPYLCELCRAISHSKLEDQGIDLSLSLQPVRISSERCWLLGMIVFELITNSARHAFAGGPGSIRIELLHSGAFIECHIADTGISDETRTPGSGLGIVKALAEGLHGTIDMQFGRRGTKSVVVFPHNPENVFQSRVCLQDMRA